MSYRYQDIPEQTFQELIGEICKIILGLGVKMYTPGKDAGIDGSFTGSAQLYPSPVDPWKGKLIIQAKHTNSCDAAFSDYDFFNTTKTGVISQEIEKIKKLIEDNRITHYMLFSNRKLTTGIEKQLIERISMETLLPADRIALIGINEIDSYLENMPQLKERFLSRFEQPDPFIFSPEALAETVEGLACALKNKDPKQSQQDTQQSSCFIRTEYVKKNKLNGATTVFANYLRKKYLQDSKQISNFLENPDSAILLEKYQEAIGDLQRHILTYRERFDSFDALWTQLIGTLKGRSSILRNHNKTFLAMLFYMYWNCDIGVSQDDSAD